MFESQFSPSAWLLLCRTSSACLPLLLSRMFEAKGRTHLPFLTFLSVFPPQIYPWSRPEFHSYPVRFIPPGMAFLINILKPQ